MYSSTKDFEIISFCHIPRRLNEVAHQMASFCQSFNCMLSSRTFIQIGWLSWYLDVLFCCSCCFCLLCCCWSSFRLKYKSFTKEKCRREHLETDVWEFRNSPNMNSLNSRKRTDPKRHICEEFQMSSGLIQTIIGNIRPIEQNSIMLMETERFEFQNSNNSIG